MPRVITVRCDNDEMYERIQRAAQLRRQSMNRFSVDVLDKEAESVLRSEGVLASDTHKGAEAAAAPDPPAAA